MAANTFFRELQRRNVIKAAVTYLAVAWVILQAAAIIFPTLNASDLAMRYLLIGLIVLLPAWLIFAWVYEYTPQGFKKTDEVDLDESIVRDTSNRMNGVIIASLVLAVLLLLTDRIFHFTEDAFHLTDEKSIAVLPFKNESSNQENQYFCNGMMEAILNHLSKIKNLRVVSRTSVEQFRNNSLSSKQIGQYLDVMYLVEGSVQRYKDKAEIFVQLIDAKTDNHIWSQSFNRDLSDVFSVQAEITKIIASHLKINILPEAEILINSIPTNNLEAYNLYLKGREYMNRYRSKTDQEDLLFAEQLYNSAIDLDSTFALAFIELGMIYLNKAGGKTIFTATNRDDLLDTVLHFANRALSIDENLAQAYYLNAWYFWYTDKMDESFINIEKSILLNSNIPEAYWLLGSYNMKIKNDPVEAISNFNRGMSLDKSDELTTLFLQNKSWIYSSVGLYDLAEQEIRSILKLQPDNVVAYSQLRWQMWIQGKFEEAVPIINKMCSITKEELSCIWDEIRSSAGLRDFSKAVTYFEEFQIKLQESRTTNRWPDYIAIYSYHKLGKTDQANKLFNESLEYWKGISTNSAQYNIGSLYAAQGNIQSAITAFESVDLKQNNWYEFISNYPIYESLWKEPAFINMVQKHREENAKIRQKFNEKLDL